MSHILRLTLAVLGCWAAAAQDTPRPQFEVASVKPSPTAEGDRLMRLKVQRELQDAMPRGFLPLNGATVSLQYTSLKQLIASAYRMRIRDVVGPSWMDDALFHIEAKVPADAPKDKVPEMLQVLLEERFALRFHRETRSPSGYVLTVAKDGPRLTPAPETSSAPVDPDDMQRRRDERMARLRAKFRSATFSNWGGSRITMEQVADRVAEWVHAPVVDQTGLSGKYTIEVDVGPPDSPDDPMDHRVSVALAELGLKLESRKVPVEVLVVHSVSKTPTEN